MCVGKLYILCNNYSCIFRFCIYFVHAIVTFLMFWPFRKTCTLTVHYIPKQYSPPTPIQTTTTSIIKNIHLFVAYEWVIMCYCLYFNKIINQSFFSDKKLLNLESVDQFLIIFILWQSMQFLQRSYKLCNSSLILSIKMLHHKSRQSP